MCFLLNNAKFLKINFVLQHLKNVRPVSTLTFQTFSIILLNKNGVQNWDCPFKLATSRLKVPHLDHMAKWAVFLLEGLYTYLTFLGMVSWDFNWPNLVSKERSWEVITALNSRVEWFMLFLGKSSSNMQRLSPNFMKRPYFEAFGAKGQGKVKNQILKVMNLKMGIKQWKFAHL